MSIFYIVFTFLFMYSTGSTMECTVDEPSQEATSTAKALFKRLRKEPGDLVLKDFREIYHLMETSFALRTKGEHTFFQGNYEDGRYYYSMVSHGHPKTIFCEEQLEFAIHLKNKPKRNGLQMKCIFEVLVHDQRVCDFIISYVHNAFVRLLNGQALLKDIQAAQTKKEFDKFLDMQPLRKARTISKARDALHKAEETAGEVKRSLVDHYVDLQKAPLTSRTDTRRRAFSQRKAVSQAHTENLISKCRKSDELAKLDPSETTEVKEVEVVEDVKDVEEAKDVKAIEAIEDIVEVVEVKKAKKEVQD